VLILLTNDDGIYAPGLAALERELRKLGEVYVVAPATEQSGVGHSITYLTPLIVKEIYFGGEHWGWAVEGRPADCVKLAVTELCPRRPDLVVSGMNYGLNAGINVLYSGTVAAAVEGAFFGITSIAVSLEFSEQAPFDRGAALARQVIEQVLRQKGPEPQLYNVNLPTAAVNADAAAEVRVVPMDVTPYGERFERRTDPWGREYYWATGLPPPGKTEHETDLSALAQGCVTLTPLDYNLTSQAALGRMAPWHFGMEPVRSEDLPQCPPQFGRPEVRHARKKRSAANGAESPTPKAEPDTTQ